jgi:hypothetical protein
MSALTLARIGVAEGAGQSQARLRRSRADESLDANVPAGVVGSPPRIRRPAASTGDRTNHGGASVVDAMQLLTAPVQAFLGPAWPVVWTLAKIVVIAMPLILGVAYLTLAERKIIGWMQVRIGPNRVGPLGLLQPFADVFKLIFKEIIVPSGASRTLFYIAPMLALAPALAAWAAYPCRRLVAADATPDCCISD